MSDTAAEKRTPLYEEHLRRGAKIDPVRRLAHAGAIHQHRGRTSGRAKKRRHLRHFAHGTADRLGTGRGGLAQQDADE